LATPACVIYCFDADAGNRTRAEGLEGRNFSEKNQKISDIESRTFLTVNANDVKKYFVLREISGISKKWLGKCKRHVIEYLDNVNWKIEENQTLNYIKKLNEDLTLTYYRKKAYQIRRFLLYLNVDWALNIKPPSEPFCTPKRITKEDIESTLSYLKKHEYYIRIKAIIFLGANSGMRALELYQLNQDDFDLDKRTVNINHNPDKGQTTKNKRSRISFFNEETRIALEEYFSFLNNGGCLKKLFPKTRMEKAFRYAPIRVKDLRKFFSQEWDRRGGPTSIKKILMGHSLKGDVDLMHYNFQSEEDLKKVYNSVMTKFEKKSIK